MSKNFDIFISYRTSENRQKAEHLYTLLESRFHGQVSYDKESFAGGRWDEQIFSRIDHCKDVIVLLTPETFAEAKGDDAAKYERWAQMPVDEVLREIEEDPKADILRTEISRAIAKGKNIVPIVHTPRETNFAEWSFPRDIAALKRFEGVLYNDDDPNQLMASLVPKIVRLLKTRKRRWWMYGLIALLVLVMVAISLLKIMDDRSLWDELSKCRTQAEYERMIDCGNQEVAQAAQDSIDEFRRLKRNYMYVNVNRSDSVAVAWSPSVSLLQLRMIEGVLDSMMYVEKGEYMMGDKMWEDIDGPMHKVVLTEDYYVSKYEMTRDVWYAVMADSVVEKNPRYPITNISFEDAQHFVNELNRLTQQKFSLPSEVEWEFAAKGQTQEAYAGGEDANDVAYWKGNSQGRVHAVGGLAPNQRELYDMSGNVSEWCIDEDSDRRAIRGGNYESDLDDLRVGHREYYKSTDKSDVIGIRLILKKQK